MSVDNPILATPNQNLRKLANRKTETLTNDKVAA